MPSYSSYYAAKHSSSYQPVAKQPLNLDQVTFLEGNAAGNEFLSSLYSQYQKYGVLSLKQIAAIDKAMEPKPEVQDVSTESLQSIAKAFAAAYKANIKRPKLYLGDFVFSPAAHSGKNPGAIYVKAGDNYLGKLIDGKYVPAYNVDADTQSQIVALCSDPLHHAVAFGKKTGKCACCNRTLTDPVSIAMGIGPICKKNWGWA